MAIRPVSSLTNQESSVFSAYEDAQDDQLVNLLQLGDDRAFETLMGRHRGLIWRVAKQYLGTIEDAEDLFQDVSLSFYQNRQSYQSGAAKFSSWLYRVATNRALDILRARKASSKNSQLNEFIALDAPTGEDTINQNQLHLQLQGLLDVLPIQQKMALSLYYYEERAISDISEILSVSEVATRSLIKRGKEKLRELGAGISF